MRYTMPTVSLKAYSRRIEPSRYPAGLANSVHFAWSEGDGRFHPLHDDYGMLFIEGTISPDNTIRSRGVVDPVLFRQPGGTYGILARPVSNDGSEQSIGGVQCWTTDDFIDFSDHGLLDITPDEISDYVRSTYGVALGDAVDVERPVLDRMRRHWDALANVAVRVPDKVRAARADDLDGIGATAVYSDGSTARKTVAWDTSGIDFDRPGTYRIDGEVTDRRYPFPLAEGYGDPVIFPWNGRYYFLATNDNLDDVGLYIREADTPQALFAPGIEEHLIVPYDESRGLIQTFWAPEFHVIGDEAYILFAVGGREWAPQCQVMHLKADMPPTDPASWEDPMPVRRRDGGPLAPNAISLDMTYIESAGVGYMVWSYREHIGETLDTGSMLYIATVDRHEPWRLTGEPVLLSRPMLGWENAEGTINNEGPNSFIADGTVYLTYSGGDACGYLYALGLLTAKVGDDLTDPGNWTKRNVPVLTFRSIDGVCGPGHNAFFVDPEGNLMISYHGETSYESRLRCDGIHRVHFGIDGRPVFDLSAARDLDPALRHVSMTVTVGR
ncbi:family 43 glycosylhydrolase [Bifidobacterium sp. SO1]|uniref:family 43 glycosylhydrolase n=1 Tax=Bifidobacterium sp. SO1 TaxID=2809029 RepID=UPI001BDD9266|nr:family 43 glycosylhydrolase [Bifidobacterium sp. SO1]MBT1162039.1 family 43 glycosylhydrolase [Bifidobacterium sp. SO1]